MTGKINYRTNNCKNIYLIFETPDKKKISRCDNCPGPDPGNSGGLTAGTNMNNAAIVTTAVEGNYD